jgi:hypothetical protein
VPHLPCAFFFLAAIIQSILAYVRQHMYEDGTGYDGSADLDARTESRGQARPTRTRVTRRACLACRVLSRSDNVSGVSSANVGHLRRAA